MIFLDTSAILALADDRDVYHRDALKRLAAAEEQEKVIVTHNYMVVESVALMQRRLDYDTARKFLHDVEAFTIIWVDDTLHHTAVEAFETNRSHGISFVDAVSFEVMRQQGITQFIGFDRHFEMAGFQPFTS